MTGIVATSIHANLMRSKMTARSILIEHPELYPALYSTRDVTGMKAKFRLVADEHGLLDAVRLLVRHIV